MSENNEVSFYDFATAISKIIELALPSLHDHHRRTAFIASNIASRMDLENEAIQEIIIASLMHDVGVFSQKELAMILSPEIYDEEQYRHADIGFNIVKNFTSLENTAYIIKYHHADFDSRKYHIPLGSHIIHLADRVSIQFDPEKDFYSQIPYIYETIAEKKEKFHPSVFDAFIRLKNSQSMWTEAVSPSVKINTLDKIQTNKIPADFITLKKYADAIAAVAG